MTDRLSVLHSWLIETNGKLLTITADNTFDRQRNKTRGTEAEREEVTFGAAHKKIVRVINMVLTPWSALWLVSGSHLLAV